jgi:hypothetical protein
MQYFLEEKEKDSELAALRARLEDAQEEENDEEDEDDDNGTAAAKAETVKERLIDTSSSSDFEATADMAKGSSFSCFNMEKRNED